MKTKQKSINNQLGRALNINKSIEIIFTWRFYFYLLYLIVVLFFVNNAILGHYENKMFAGFIWLLFVLSYPMSIFLIKVEGGY